MTGKLIKPVVARRSEVPSVIEELPAGATVEFDLTSGVAEVVNDGHVYSALLDDLLDAAHPIEWVRRKTSDAF